MLGIWRLRKASAFAGRCAVGARRKNAHSEKLLTRFVVAAFIPSNAVAELLAECPCYSIHAGCKADLTIRDGDDFDAEDEQCTAPIGILCDFLAVCMERVAVVFERDAGLRPESIA